VSKKFFLFFFLFLLSFSLVSALDFQEDCSVESETCSVIVPAETEVTGETIASDIEHDPDKICLIFFYGIGCPHCASVEPFIREVAEKYGDKVSLHELEIYHNLENYQLYTKYCGVQNIPISKRGIPLLAINDKALMGEDPIRDNLEKEIEFMIENDVDVCPLPDEMSCSNIESNATQIDPAIQNMDSKITLPLIVGTGLLDGINPCAFAVLIFLLSFLLEIASDKKRMIKAGLAYIFSVYVTYFLAGLGLLTVIQVSGMSKYVIYAAATVAIVTGLINIKDYFWYGKGISLGIPASKKHIIEKWTKKANVPAAIVLGFLVSMFELPCTGGVYLAILAMLASSVTKLVAMFYLLIYNFMFVLPLIVILAALVLGMKAEHIESWRSAKKNIMRLVLGLLLLGLGIGLLLGWF